MKIKSILFKIFFFCFLGFYQPVITAQNEQQINPLIENFNSDLIPKINRDLSDFEIKRIENRISELNLSAEEQLKANNQDQAFIMLYEAINLSRYLETNVEIELITKVGQIAWDKSRNQDLNFLNERLNILENQLGQQGQLNPETNLLLLTAYETIRNIDKSINISQRKLDIARNNNDSQGVKFALDKLGNLYLAKFDYFNAEPIYKELLTIARTNQDYLGEGIYLRRLAEISQALVNPENSVKYKEELAKTNLINQNVSSLAMLKISIGNDYQSLNNPQLASQFYQDAFSLAWSLQQYAIAGDALKSLGRLYQEYEQWDSALQIYQELIAIEQQSYNLYGLMNTYDYIAMIHREKQQYNQAMEYLQKALEIARHLNHKEDYFSQKITEMNNK